MKTIYPDYNNCLTNITNSLLKYYNLNTYHETLKDLDNILKEKEYKNIVLMLYDGMGYNLLERNLDSNAFLNKNKIKSISAVFPPTTTASTTSVLSGLNPNEHGWLGWDLYFKNIDKTVTMFLNTIKDTNIEVSSKSISKETYPYTSIIDLIGTKVNSLGLFPFGENPYKDLDDMHNIILETCNNNKNNFIYAYYDEPDHTMHELGTDSNKTINIFNEINNKTESLCHKLKDTLVIIIADHGHINSECITLSDYPDIFNTLEHDISIESRATSFFIKEGECKNFEYLFNTYFGKYFHLFTKEEVIKKNLFGTGQNNKNFNDVIGNFLAVATSNKYFRYDSNGNMFKSMHAGLTEDEMLVPLIIYRS
jgi:hypothetical protein